MLDRFRPRFYFDADGGGNGGSGNGGDGSDAGENAGDGNNTITFTSEQQAHIDKLLGDRLAREKKTLRKSIEDELKAEAAKANLSEVEKLKAEKAEAEKKAADTTTVADKRIINAESRIQAAALGVAPERISYVLKLADLTTVEIGDDGEPDAKAIKTALEAVKKELPELFSGEVRPKRSGFDFTGGGGGSGKTDMNAFIRRGAGR
jgi:hypothetical protein